MKKIKGLIIALFAVALLAGCSMKYDFSLKIANDKKVGVTVKLALDNETIDSMLSLSDMEGDVNTTKTYTDQDRMNYMKENSCKEVADGYTCETFQEGNYTGVIMNTDKVDIDSITGTGTEKVNIMDTTGTMTENSLFVKDGDVYKSNLTYNVADNTEMGSYYSQADNFVFTFEVVLPNKSITNNADKVSSDGLTLSWDLSKATDKDIEFSFKFDGTGTNTTTGTNSNGNDVGNDIYNTAQNQIDNARETAGKILGMSKTAFIILIVGVILGLILISVLIIIFARKSSGSNNSSNSNNSASAETAKLFKNPELSTPKEAKSEPKEEAAEEPTEESKKEE